MLEYFTRKIIFLHGFVKKTHKTPKKDLAVAKKRLKSLTSITNKLY